MSGEPSPAAVPAAIWNVPYPRNPNFTGRGKAMAELRQALAGKAAADRIQVVFGPSGIGKSQLAAGVRVQAQVRLRDRLVAARLTSRRRWRWARVSSPSGSVSTSATPPARRTSAPAPPRPGAAAELAAHIRQRLFARGGQGISADAVNGHVVVTSRSTNWPNFGGSLPLGTLSRGEAISLLRKRTARNDSNESRLQALPGARRLADCGGSSGRGHRAEARLIRKLPGEFRIALGRAADDRQALGRLPRRRSRWLWSCRCGSSSKARPGAAEMLALCAFLAHEQISQPFLASSAPYVAAPLIDALADAMTLDASLALLGAHSMAHAGEQALAVHPLVASFVRTRMSAETRRRWTDIALQRVAGAFVYQSQDVSTWSSCGEVLPHVLAVADHGEREQVGPGGRRATARRRRAILASNGAFRAREGPVRARDRDLRARLRNFASRRSRLSPTISDAF
jgi:hypothetical protein